MASLDFLRKNELDRIKELEELLEKYQPIINIEAEVMARKNELDTTIAEKEFQINNLQATLGRYNEISELNQKIRSEKERLDRIIDEKELKINSYESTIGRFKEISELNQKIRSTKQDFEIMSQQYIELKDKYTSSKELYRKLLHEINVFENKLDLSEYGIYQPIYDFDKSDQYRDKQNQIREAQKEMINEGTAATCSKNWTIDGSEAKGKASTTRLVKLVLRAFNGESDALIAKVKWNNVNQLRDRILKSYEAINKLGEGNAVAINRTYYTLKIQELKLEYEYQAKKQREKEAMKAIQDELREEEKAKRDFERAQKQAEKEEGIYQRALEKIQREMGVADLETQARLKEQIAVLEAELEEARLRKERALSMAQQTKRGHVYIISNIGSFGENVYKIGMTRRLEPLDRVRELGDASVPFLFDVHAMIYSDEARTLENELHKAFEHRKVNMLNQKREFFKVTLEEIEEQIKILGFKAEFTALAEAMEYRNTLSLLENILTDRQQINVEQYLEASFPGEI
ncbi:DUF4041 domain-containing protein [Flavobacterium sp.]|uniref:DUF4041 domain-containing protein n=1 Tax=Flavobacterium sp. TaxID=239 RepID=UPI0040338D77